jgi:hypothetical protein
MLRMRLALAAGLGITVIAVVAVLSESPLTVLASNGLALSELHTVPYTSAVSCQGGERLPQGTEAIRLWLGQFTGTAVALEVVAGDRVLTSGEHGAGWAGQNVTVAVTPASHPVAPVKICISFLALGGEQVTVLGSDHRIRIEYLGKGRSSWLALLPTVARNMRFGRAWSGIWVAFLVPSLMLIAAILASRLATRDIDE